MTHIKLLAQYYNSKLYEVDLELQYQIPIILFLAYGLCSVIRLTIIGRLRYVVFAIFTASYCGMWYVLMLDHGIITRIMVVTIALFGCISGVSPGVKYLIMKFKNLGDDNKFLG